MHEFSIVCIYTHKQNIKSQNLTTTKENKTYLNKRWKRWRQITKQYWKESEDSENLCQIAKSRRKENGLGTNMADMMTHMTRMTGWLAGLQFVKTHHNDFLLFKRVVITTVNCFHFFQNIKTPNRGVLLKYQLILIYKCLLELVETELSWLFTKGKKIRHTNIGETLGFCWNFTGFLLVSLRSVPTLEMWYKYQHWNFNIICQCW